MVFRSRSQQIAIYGLLISLAAIVGYLESFIPMPFYLPGMKLGLSNSIILLSMYLIKPRSGIIINVVRIMILAFTFGNLFGMAYSFSGAFLSFVVMALAIKADYFSPMGVSMVGGCCHNLGQLMMALFLVNNLNLMYYLPILIVGGIVTGIINGLIMQEIYKRVEPMVLIKE